MFFAEPKRTSYDLLFNFASIPCRVHPLFWVAALVLGARLAEGENAGIYLLMWIGVMFVSILIHELGHAFTMRYFGNSAHVVLYMLGGLAIPDANPWDNSYYDKSQSSPWTKILISFAGPGAGFVFAGLIVAAVYSLGGSIQFMWGGFDLLIWYVNVENEHLGFLVHCLLFLNIYWGLVNLLPIYPLDGGQISRELFLWKDPYNGMLRSLWLSVFAGAAMAGLGIMQMINSEGRDGFFLVLLFGSLAWSSYSMIQQTMGGFGGGGFGGGQRRDW